MGVASVQVAESDVGIDYEKLKVQEKIHFFDEVVLFEDELADNGIAVLRVKIVSQINDVINYCQF